MLERFLKYSYIIMLCFLIGEECSKFIFINFETIPMNILRMAVYLTLLCYLIDKSNINVYSIVNDDGEIEGTFSTIDDTLMFLDKLNDEFPFPERKIILHKLYNNSDWKEVDIHSIKGKIIHEEGKEHE